MSSSGARVRIAEAVPRDVDAVDARELRRPLDDGAAGTTAGGGGAGRVAGEREKLNASAMTDERYARVSATRATASWIVTDQPTRSTSSIRPTK